MEKSETPSRYVVACKGVVVEENGRYDVRAMVGEWSVIRGLNVIMIIGRVFECQGWRMSNMTCRSSVYENYTAGGDIGRKFGISKKDMLNSKLEVQGKLPILPYLCVLATKPRYGHMRDMPGLMS